MTLTTARRRAATTALATSLAALVAAPLGAQEVQEVPRDRTLVHIGWSAGSPTLNSPQNGNWYALASDLRNGLMYHNEHLFYYNQFKGEHIPWLSTGYEYNDDYTSVTLNLREGVKWSDGEDFDAEDVAYTLNMLIENGKGAQDLRKAIEVANQVEQAEVVDKHTVRIDLLEADPRYVFRQLTGYFGHGLIWVPEHIWQDVEDKADFTFFDLEKGWPVGTGAWQVVRAEGNQIVLDRRDDWWGAETGFRNLPAVERVITVPAPDTERNAQLLVNNEADISHGLPTPRIMRSSLARNEALTTFTGREAPYGYLDWWPHALYFNHMAEPSPFQDIRVREAVRFAIDRDQVVEFVWEGSNEPNCWPYPGYEPLKPYLEAAEHLLEKHRACEHNLDETERLMTEAGYAKDGDGFWAKDGERVGGPVEVQPALADVAQIVVQQLRNAGFDAQYSQTPDSFRRFRAGESLWHVFGHNGGSIFDPVDTLRMYKCENQSPIGKISFFVARWCDPELDEIIEKMEALPVNHPDLEPLFVEAMDIWLADAVEVPIEENYHLVLMNETHWTNFPSEDNPYAPACVSCFISGWGTLVAHHLEPQN